MKNKTLVIFDLDGTLIDSVPDISVALNHTLKELKRKTYTEEQVRLWVGEGAFVLIKRALLGQKEIDNKLLDEALAKKEFEIFLEFYLKNPCTFTKLYPSVLETLKTLQRRGYRLAIASNKPVAFIEPILQALQIDEFFEYHLGGDSLAQKKPDPLPLVHLLKELAVEVEASVMVGDSRNDILVANAVNMESVAVSYGYAQGENLEEYQPSVMIDSFEELLLFLP